MWNYIKHSGYCRGKSLSPHCQNSLQPQADPFRPQVDDYELRAGKRPQPMRRSVRSSRNHLIFLIETELWSIPRHPPITDAVLPGIITINLEYFIRLKSAITFSSYHIKACLKSVVILEFRKNYGMLLVSLLEFLWIMFGPATCISPPIDWTICTIFRRRQIPAWLVRVYFANDPRSGPGWKRGK